MTAPRELRTARLLLRSFESKDAPAVARLAGAKEIAATTVQIPHPYAEEDARRFFAQSEEEFQQGRCVAFAIAVLQSGELCGAVGLHVDNPNARAELGYWIGVPFWRRGYATEAASAAVSFGFEDLGLNRIFAHYFAGNRASQRVLEKIGMRLEGSFPQHIRKWDRFIDIENYGLLAKDFRARSSSR